MKRTSLENTVLKIMLSDMELLMEYTEAEIRSNIAMATDDQLLSFLDE